MKTYWEFIRCEEYDRQPIEALGIVHIELPEDQVHRAASWFAEHLRCKFNHWVGCEWLFGQENLSEDSKCAWVRILIYNMHVEDRNDELIAAIKRYLWTPPGVTEMFREDTRTLKDLAREAMQCQDASNLCGLAQSFARAMRRLNDLGKSTEDTNRHAVAVLWASKLASLTGLGSGDFATFSEAWDECQVIIKGDDE